MQNLLQLLSEKSYLPLTTCDAIKSHTIDRPLSTYPDPNLIKHDKYADKEYFLEDEINIHDEFPFILSVTLENYGYLEDDVFTSDFQDGRGIKYDISKYNQRLSTIEMRGILTGGYAEIDFDATCRLAIEGISKKDYDNLPLHESLAIEAYLLAQESNYKMAFFTYFSAAEAILRLKTDKIKTELYPELEYAIEHLPLLDKARIAARHKFETADLNTLPLWGELMGLVKSCNSTRNEIAHGLIKATLTSENVANAAACYIVLKQALINGLSSMPKIVSIYKPKKLKKPSRN